MSKAYHPRLGTKYLLGRIKAGEKDNNKEFFSTKEVFAEEGADNKYATSLEELLNDQTFRATTHLLRFHAKAFDKLARNLIAAIKDVTKQDRSVEEIFDKRPLLIPGKEHNDIIVFKNTKLSRPSFDSLSYVSWVTKTEVLKDFYLDYRADTDNTVKAQAWDGFKRSLHRVWATEVLVVERALARHTNLTALGYKDNIIRDVAIAYVEALKPIDIRFTSKPEDFLEMYSSGPESCMALSKAERTTAWQCLIKAKLHPASFYGYSPYCKGAYLMSGKTIAARTICFQHETGQWVYGRVYGASPRYATQLMNGLAQADIKPLSPEQPGVGGHFFERSYTFEIPGIDTEGTNTPGGGKNVYAMPLPYLDNFSRQLFVSWDKKRKVFIVNVHSGKANNVQTDSTVGFVLSNKLEHVECHVCHKSVIANKAISSQDGEADFCSPSCAAAMDYCHAFRSDGLRVWVKIGDCVRDDFSNPFVYYTNPDAAKQLGAFPFIASIDERPEEGTELYTRIKGKVVELSEKEVFRLSDEEFLRLSDVGLLRSKGEKIYGTHYVLKTIVPLNTPIELKKQSVVIIEENFSVVSRKDVDNILAALL